MFTIRLVELHRTTEFCVKSVATIVTRVKGVAQVSATSVAVFGMKTLMKYLKELTHEPDCVLFHKKLTGVH